MVIVAGDKIIGVGRRSKTLEIVSRSEGKSLWSGNAETEGAVINDSLAAAHGSVFFCTDKSEVVCLDGTMGQ